MTYPSLAMISCVVLIGCSNHTWVKARDNADDFYTANNRCRSEVRGQQFCSNYRERGLAGQLAELTVKGMYGENSYCLALEESCMEKYGWKLETKK